MTKKRGTIFFLPVGLALVFSLSLRPAYSQEIPLNQYGVRSTNPYVVDRFVVNGQTIEKIIVPGPPSPPIGFYRPSVDVPPVSNKAAGINILPNVPASTWAFGCSATSASMMFGYYDNSGFANMYAGPTNGGLFPMTNATWGTVVINGETRALNPLSATRNGLDGRAIKGHVDDYWVRYLDGGPDPFISGGWTEHAQGECTGDFMGTNQSAFGNVDGSTTFYYFPSGNPLYDYTGGEPGARDGCHGLKLFVESRGYSVASSGNFTQLIREYTGTTTGFTFADFKAEIDAGRPVLIQVQGHTMLGFGYDDAGSTVYIHDTWDYSDHTMTWGGSYAGMTQWGVTVCRLVSPSPADSLTVLAPNGGESWVEGSVHNITWTTIVSSTANTGTYAWTVPSVVSADCLIRISGDPSGIPSDASDSVFAITASEPSLHLSKTTFNFGSEQYGTPTAPESCVVSKSGTGIINWTAAASAGWLGVTPGAGTGAATLTISILDTTLSPGNYQGTITVADPAASNSPQTITVNLHLYETGSDGPPFGVFETPLDGATVVSSIPVTGWVLDDIGMAGVKIYRGTGLSDRIYIGDAVFVRGARNDVESAYPEYPQNDVAGWGYMLLTNFLPNGGNGTFALLAYAKDTGGHEVLLGTKTIICDNAHAVLPFGAIDTPSQGGTASGTGYMNFGWALTPLPNSIPIDGSTILVWVDSLPLGHPAYNYYREDIATLFPGYVNSNGAVGLYFLDTSNYEDGVHEIAWSVADSSDNVDGIGSRYFSILNSVGGTSPGFSPGKTTPSSEEMSGLREDARTPVYVRRGMPAAPAERIVPEVGGAVRIEIPEITRVAVYLNEKDAVETEAELIERGSRITHNREASVARYNAYSIVLDEFRPLPVGATFDSVRGVLYWQPGPGFLGEHVFVIVDDIAGTKKSVKILIRPSPGKSGSGFSRTPPKNGSFNTVETAF